MGNDVIGFIGVALMLTPYILNLFKKLSVDSLYYSGLNIVGSTLCVVYSFNISAYPFMILETIWGVTSLYAFVDDTLTKLKN